MNSQEIKFFPLDISYQISEEGGVEISIFGITLDRKKIRIFDSFLPYFCAIVDKKADAEKLIQKIRETELVVDVKLESKKYIQDNVKAIKIFAKNPSDLRQIREKLRNFEGISEIAEGDISLRKKYLIDNNITPYTLCGVEGRIERRGFGDIDLTVIAEKITRISSDLIGNPRVLAFDIETLCMGSAPNAKEDPVIMCSFYGSNNFKRVITWKPIRNAPEYMRFVGGEQELINEIIRTIREFDPEILVGYGSDFFDFPYIINRTKKYKMPLNIGWDGSEPMTRLRLGRGTTKLKGIVHLDISQFIRNVLSPNLESERLDLNRVGKELVGIGKSLDLKDTSINVLWDGTNEDLLKLVEYNLRDSEIVFKIVEKVLPTQFQLAKIINLPLFDVNRMTYSQLVEQFLLKNAPDFNQVIPRRPLYSEIKKRRQQTYVGGFVFEPEANLYENIGSFDYRSLYPSLISAYNIGPTTLNCDCCGPSSEKVEVDGEEYWFCGKEDGFLSILIRDLVDRRKRIKQILKDTKKTDSSYQELNALSYALKTLANATYGYLGFAGARWYCLECARAITALGRKYIDQVIKTAHKLGFEPIYADTDGAFILLKNKEGQVDKFLKKINSTLPDPMELEYHGKYKRGLFLGKKSGAGGAKKRYALLSDDGDIILKGIEAIRGDWSPIAKKTQREVVEIILKEKSVDKAAEYVKNLIDKLKSRDVQVYDLAIEATLTRDLRNYEFKGPHVAAAEIAKRKGYFVRRGFIVSYIVCSGSGKISERVKLTEDARVQDYDINYYINHQIIRSVYKIFELFNYPIEKLKSGQSELTNW
ncbi:MAG: hypothetical protein JSW73_05615 [Candidatus Woesearchaeota archaeon]|nr:MAG: hypothetical protein JSW73_05615 [Candidatus Woesearchaeota archaeon]